MKNAQVLEKKGAAIIIQEKEMKINYFLETILKLLKNKTELQKMKEASKLLGNPNSTTEIVDNIMRELKWLSEKLKIYFLLELVELAWVV